MTPAWFEGDGDPAPSAGLVTLARFTNPAEAQIVRGMLESAGIDCFLAGENINNALQAAFRVRLQVAADDEASARQLIERNEDEPAEADWS